MDRYREKIIMSYLYLQSMRDGLMDNIINLAMAGEYKSISDTFSLGDSYEFDVLQFRDTDDVNLNRLLDVYDEMDAAMDSLINLNLITEEEIEKVEMDWLDLMAFNLLDEEDEEFEDEFEEENWDDLEDFYFGGEQNGEDLEWEEE